MLYQNRKYFKFFLITEEHFLLTVYINNNIKIIICNIINNNYNITAKLSNYFEIYKIRNKVRRTIHNERWMQLIN